MNLDTPGDWIAWAGIVLPLITLAWAATQYVNVEAKKAKRQRFEDFKSLCEDLNSENITTQVAVIFEMRKYPEYKEVIGRLLGQITIMGTASELITDEMDITLAKLNLDKRKP